MKDQKEKCLESTQKGKTYVLPKIVSSCCLNDSLTLMHLLGKCELQVSDKMRIGTALRLGASWFYTAQSRNVAVTKFRSFRSRRHTGSHAAEAKAYLSFSSNVNVKKQVFWQKSRRRISSTRLIL